MSAPTPETPPGLTQALAAFIARTTLDDAPAAAVEKSKKVLADTFAVMLAGRAGDVAPPLLRYLDRANAPGPCRILATDRRTSKELAALVNGTFGHALDFDDVLPMMPGHPSAIIVAAALAAATSAPLSGRRLIEAHVVGIEVGAKIGLAITHGHYARGFHGTGTLGIFSALGALARIERLDAGVVAAALGIAASMASGVRRNFGTMVKPFHTGWAARNALVATELANCGMSAAPDALEGKTGFFAAYGVEDSAPENAVAALGAPWAIVDPGVGLKLWPCYNGVQRPMWGLLELRERMGFTAEDIERVQCRMAPGATRVMVYPRPTTGLEGKFSLHYTLAAGALDGRYGFATFSDAAVARAPIRALLERIELTEDERCGAGDPQLHTRAAGARGFVEVEVRTRDGRTDTVRVDTIPGHPSKEMTWDALAAKFADCAREGGIDASRAARAFEMIHRLEACADVEQIVDLLTV